MKIWVLWEAEEGYEKIWGVYSTLEKAEAAEKKRGVTADVITEVELDALPKIW